MARDNAARFEMMKNRSREMMKGSREDIERNTTQRVSMCTFAEYDWLVNAVSQLCDGDVNKLNKLDLPLVGEPPEAAPTPKSKAAA